MPVCRKLSTSDPPLLACVHPRPSGTRMQSSLTGPTTPSDLLQQLHKSYGALTEAVNFSLGTGDTLITTDNGGYRKS